MFSSGDNYLDNRRFCGNRRLQKSHCYLTDVGRVRSSIDTLPLLMRGDSGVDIVYRTDDERHVHAGVPVVEDKCSLPQYSEVLLADCLTCQIPDCQVA